jgi:transposase-like protein
MRGETFVDSNLPTTLSKPSLASPVAMTRTRCPACKKLFSVETETLLAMTRAGAYRAEFTCTSDFCRTSFAIALPLPVGFDTLGIIPAVQFQSSINDFSRTESARPASILQQHVQADFLEESVAHSELSHRSANQAYQNEAYQNDAHQNEKECPRCNAKNSVSQSECVRCGIVFSRYGSGAIGTNADLRIEEEMALGGTRELAALWDRLIEDYEDRIRHDRFINACRDGKALSYAAKKYSQILVSTPQDEIARIMRNRIVALVSAQAETSKIPIRLDFRIPSLNKMALAMGSILFFWGLLMPQLKNIMEIGLSMVLLAIGVRLALRARV